MVDSTVQALTQEFDKFKNARNSFEPDWYLNVAYYYGHQWVFWNRGHLDNPKLANWRLMLVDNRILPVAFSRISRKVKNRPSFVVTPNSFDEEDLVAAEMGGKILDDDWIGLDLGAKLFAALLWSEVTGAGFWKLYWDKTKGESEDYVFTPQNEVYRTGEGKGRPVRAGSEPGKALLDVQGFESKPISQGNVCIDVLSPFHIFPQPLAEQVHESEVIFEEHIRSIEYVKTHYNEDLEGDTNIPAGVAEGRMLASMGGIGDSSQYKGVTIYERYEKPGSSEAQGKRVVYTKEKVLEESTLEDAPFAGCPYVMFRGIDVPGRFWPTCVTTQLRGPQTDLNKLESQVRENALRIGNPSVLMSRQANTTWTGVPGEVVQYDSTFPDSVPSFLQPPEMPSYVQQDIERIERSITEISGLHEVSKASVPAGVTAASAINLLMEADETRIGPEITQMERVIGEAGSKLLKLRAKFQDDERTIRQAGEDGEWDIFSWRNTMLKGNTNVEVQAGSAMPKMKAAKQAAMQEMLALMLQYGVEIDPRDLRKFMREFGVGGLESMFAGMSNDELQIRREHNHMKSGEPIDINDFDNHDYHISGHDEFRKTKVYYMLPDQIKQIIDLHVQAHMEARNAAIQMQVQQQQQEAAATLQVQNPPPTTTNGGQGASKSVR